MKVACVIPCHERLQISIETINLLKDKQSLKPTVIVVGWSHVEEKIAKATNSLFVKCVNVPLGNKWQMGIEAARDLDVDAVLILGSDTWLTPDWIKFCASKIKDGADLVGKIRWYSCNLKVQQSIEIIHCGYHTSPAADYPVGGGRMISKRILDKMNWQLYPKDIKRCLDIASAKQMNVHNPRIDIFNTNKHKIMGIKGPWPTLNPFSRLKKASNSKIQRFEDVPAEGMINWLKIHFPGSLHAINRIMPDFNLWN